MPTSHYHVILTEENIESLQYSHFSSLFISVLFSQLSEQVNLISDLSHHFQKSCISQSQKYSKEKKNGKLLHLHFCTYQYLSGHSSEQPALAGTVLSKGLDWVTSMGATVTLWACGIDKF